MTGVYDQKSLRIARRKQLEKDRYEEIQRQALHPVGASRDNASTEDHGREFDETIKELNMLSASVDKEAQGNDRESSSVKHNEVPSAPTADHSKTNLFQQTDPVPKDEGDDGRRKTEKVRVKTPQRSEKTDSAKNVTPNVTDNMERAATTDNQAPERSNAFKITPVFKFRVTITAGHQERKTKTDAIHDSRSDVNEENDSDTNDPVPTAMKMASKKTVPQKSSKPNMTTPVLQGRSDGGTLLEGKHNYVKASSPSLTVTGSKPIAMQIPKGQKNTKADGKQNKVQMAKDESDSDENLPIPAALRVAKKTTVQQKSPPMQSLTPVETHKNDTTVKRDMSATCKFGNKNEKQPSGVTSGTLERDYAQESRPVSDKPCDIENIEAVLDKKAEEISQAFRKFKDQQSRMYKCPGL